MVRQAPRALILSVSKDEAQSLFECAASAFTGPFDRAQDGVSELKNINFPMHRVPDACVGEPQIFAL